MAGNNEDSATSATFPPALLFRGGCWVPKAESIYFCSWTDDCIFTFCPIQPNVLLYCTQGRHEATDRYYWCHIQKGKSHDWPVIVEGRGEMDQEPWCLWIDAKIPTSTMAKNQVETVSFSFVTSFDLALQTLWESMHLKRGLLRNVLPQTGSMSKVPYGRRAPIEVEAATFRA